jgi:hypothetical protein
MNCTYPAFHIITVRTVTFKASLATRSALPGLDDEGTPVGRDGKVLARFMRTAPRAFMCMRIRSVAGTASAAGGATSRRCCSGAARAARSSSSCAASWRSSVAAHASIVDASEEPTSSTKAASASSTSAGPSSGDFASTSNTPIWTASPTRPASSTPPVAYGPTRSTTSTASSPPTECPPASTSCQSSDTTAPKPPGATVPPPTDLRPSTSKVAGALRDRGSRAAESRPRRWGRLSGSCSTGCSVGRSSAGAAGHCGGAAHTVVREVGADRGRVGRHRAVGAEDAAGAQGGGVDADRGAGEAGC